MEYITRFSDMTNTALRRHTHTTALCRPFQTRASRTGNGGFFHNCNTGGGASEDEEAA